MAAIPQKVIDRYSKLVPRYQKILASAKDRDLGEADTVTIIKDILNEVFGYDKYTEITGEYAIHGGTKCDLAVKIDNKLRLLIEAKAVGVDLRENQIKQAIDYGAHQGISWVVLTNGVNWNIYKVRLEPRVDADLVSSFSFLELNARKAEDRDKLFLISRNGMEKEALEDFYERSRCVNRFVIGALVLTEPVLNEIRKELRKTADGLKVDIEEIETILRNEVFKRDVFDGEDAKKADAIIRKLARKARKAEVSSTKTKVASLASDVVAKPAPQKESKAQN